MLDTKDWFTDCEDLAERTLSERARGLEGSAILGIAGEVTDLVAQGATVANFTVGDFAPGVFAIPPLLTRAIEDALRAGKTNYPPAVGVAELRKAIRDLYKRELGLDYPEGTVQIGAGARPPLYAAFATIIQPGDQVVYPVPSWNNHYYTYLYRAEGVALVTKAENGFLVTREELEPYLKTARMICLNSPSNPTGTVFGEDQLRDICEAVVAENRRRRAVGDRPLMVLYDQVYWQLSFDRPHFTPPGLVPEMARYTLFIDAISKCWAGTGLRVGWGVFPPWVLSRTKPLVGHMGAWAARPEQHATAAVLADHEAMKPWMAEFTSTIRARLERVRSGILAMKAEGMPVDALPAEGAIYLTVQFDLLGKSLDGRTIDSDEHIRSLLLHEAGVAIVPFTAFGLPDDTGWVRFSVGAVTDADIDGALTRIRGLLVRVTA